VKLKEKEEEIKVLQKCNEQVKNTNDRLSIELSLLQEVDVTSIEKSINEEAIKNSVSNYSIKYNVCVKQSSRGFKKPLRVKKISSL